MHLTDLCIHVLHALPHDITGRFMQLLHGLCCSDFVSDIPFLQLLCSDPVRDHGLASDNHLVLSTYLGQGILKGRYHCTVDLLFEWFGINCMPTDNFCFYLQNRLIQISQTGGQGYSDTSPFCIPCLGLQGTMRDAQKLMGENLKLVWAEFSTLS
jgi:hypothetical protein